MYVSGGVCVLIHMIKYGYLEKNTHLKNIKFAAWCGFPHATGRLKNVKV